jgi:uncharacterized protein (TIGR02246 family)
MTAAIETLIRDWAAAVHRGDLPGVLAHHADDVVMFDVPPPQDGVRGLDAYAAVWPDFFRWQAGGAVFEIVSLEVTEGADVAYAFALLRCGEPPVGDGRLRVSFGLRRVDGEWLIAHEHHSFTHPAD